MPKYSWEPESGLPLANGPIDGSAFELTLFNNLAEFLGGYFNGQQHYLFAKSKQPLFQSVDLRFQQSQEIQPLEGACIRAVLANSGTGIQTQYGNAWRTRQTVGLEFYVTASVKKPRPDGWNSYYLCRNVADCLYGLLLDRGASIPLQVNGFRRIRPQNPAVMQDVMYSTRRIRCSMDVWFLTPASNAVDSVLGGDV